MKEIRFNSGFPFAEWTVVGEKKEHKLPAEVGGKTLYLAPQLVVLEGENEGMEVNPKSPNIEIRDRKNGGNGMV